MTSSSATFLLPEYASPPAEAPGLTYQPDHAGEAERRLLSQFDSAARLHALVRALGSAVRARGRRPGTSNTAS